eukprot:c7547_g1_i1.p1 GENE.c7547_g1_i1~~c7547_g1_i1.p1  ORF type:complete len:1185 (+),score=369.74 c7547_g1_i1:317-3556(+)
MVVSMLLKQDTTTTDESTGLRKVFAKDVWSCVQPNQQVSAAAYGARATAARPSAVVSPLAGFGAPPYGAYPQPFYPQPAFHPPQRTMSGNVVAYNHVPPVVSAAGAQAAADYIQQQILQDKRSGPVGPKSNANDSELNSRLTKAVTEVSGLKQKLKESQRDQREMLKASKDVEERYEAQLKQANERISELEGELESTRRAKEEIQKKALEQGKSAAAAEAAESLKRELQSQAETANRIQMSLQQELANIKSQLESSRTTCFDLQAQVAKAETEANDRTAVLNAKQTELSLVRDVIKGFGPAVEDDKIRREVMNDRMPLQDRLSSLLQYLEKRSAKLDPSIFTPTLQTCAALREDIDRYKKNIRTEISKQVEQSMTFLKSQVQMFITESDKEKQVYVERYHKQFDERKRLANEIIDMKGKIRVYGRARPFNQREREAGHANVLAFPEANRLLIGANAEAYLNLNDVALGQETEIGQNKIDDVKTYELDHIFSPTTTQDQVFEEVRLLIGSVLDGYNVTVFAYGQTGSGKTHTMDGSADNPGLTYRSLGLFFDTDKTAETGRQLRRRKSVLKPRVDVEISMLEIYNEEIRDLLDESDKKKDKLEVRQSADGGSYVPGIVKLKAESLEHAISIMDLGRENRKTSATKMNATSSRSHMIFTAYVTVTNPVTKDVTMSKLHLVDLAGSERVSKTGASGDQLKEAMAINKSLSALGDVIAALTSSAEKAHVPYRNSKLTFLLQDSLCGNSRTAMFVALSPSSDNYWETISTLNFGARAASVELGQVQKNFQSGELAQLREQVTRLQSQLVQQKTSVGGATDELNSLRNRLSDVEKESDLKEKKLKLLISKNEELVNEINKRDDDSNKRLDKARSDIKARDDQIRELEDLIKKNKKEALGTVKDTTELDNALKEVSNLRKQLQELNKALKQTETKVQTAESRVKKAEQRASKAEEDLARARENASKPSRDVTRSSPTSVFLSTKATAVGDVNKVGYNAKRTVNVRTSPRNSPREELMEDTVAQLNESSIDGSDDVTVAESLLSGRPGSNRKSSRMNSTFLRKGQGQGPATRTTSLAPTDPIEDEDV